jgi:hypothetical protein
MGVHTVFSVAEAVGSFGLGTGWNVLRHAGGRSGASADVAETRVLRVLAHVVQKKAVAALLESGKHLSQGVEEQR